MRRLAGGVVAALALGLLVAHPAGAATQPAAVRPGVTAAAGTLYEAEQATRSDGSVDSNWPGFTGTGFVNGANAAGSYVEFTVNATSAGSHTLAFRYANGGSTARSADISVGGTVVADEASFAATGAWDSWTDLTVTANLVAGANKIRVTSTAASGNANIDSLTITSAADTTPPSAPTDFRLEGQARPTGVDLAWGAATDNVGVVTYKVYDGSTVKAEVAGTALSTQLTGLTPQTHYALSVRAVDAAGNESPASAVVDVTTPADNPSPAASYEAEQALRSDGTVDSNWPGFTGTGFVNGANAAGSYVEFTVTAASAGSHTLAFRYANGGTTARTADISVGGTVVADEAAFTSTGAWDAWADKTVTANLVAGANKIRITSTSAAGNANIDSLTVTGTGSADTQPPTAPTDFRLEGEARPYSLNVAWGAATDNVGVVTYKVYDGGNVKAEVGGNVLSTQLTGLSPSTRYILRVYALDAAGNESPASTVIDVTTPADVDTTPPTVPANLRSTTVTGSSATLLWDASTDTGSGVKGYNVYRDGTKVADAPDTTATIDGLAPGTDYSFTVEAYDFSGNTSAKSAAVAVRTPAVGGGGDPVYDRDVNTAMDVPWGIAFLPDKTALVAERDRFEIVKVAQDGTRSVVGKITEAVTTGGEGGLLGLAVSPKFATDNYVYVFYTSASDNRVARFTYKNGVMGPREPIVTGISKSTFHNGGRIKFGPDGMLYITTGDGQTSSRAQSKSSLNGKILRVTPTGAAAPGNPFPDAPLVYSMGHRNPQGIAWDSQGRLWAAEFGDSKFDELNLITPGGNYGWPTCEGTCSDSRYINPVQSWDVASASPSGLEIVNDWIYMAAVRGQRLWVMHIEGNTTDTPRAFFNNRWGRLRTVVKAPDGGLWLTSTNNDKKGGTPGTLDNVIVKLRFDQTLALTSSAFSAGAGIPTRYTCQQDGAAGNDISPDLSWANAPAGTKSYAVVLTDLTNNGKHWVIWDVPSSKAGLPSGLGLGYNVPNQSPAKQKAMKSGNQSLQYFGPCPGGSPHEYEFKVYALKVSTLPGVSSSSSVATVESALKANSLGVATLKGMSSAKAN